jgi:hypothetical protein
VRDLGPGDRPVQARPRALHRGLQTPTACASATSVGGTEVEEGPGANWPPALARDGLWYFRDPGLL